MIEERLNALRRDWSGLRAACEAAVRRVEFGSEEALWIPAPPLPPRPNAAPPHLVPEPAPGSWSWDRLAGLDDQGRAVLVRRARGHHDEPPAAVLALPSESVRNEDGSVTGLGHLLVRYEAQRTEVVRFGTWDEIVELTWIDHDETGRPVTFTATGERGHSVTTCVWDGDRCVRMDRDGVVVSGEHDAAGLVRVLEGDRVTWERHLHGFEPDPLPADEALGTWAAAVATAAERAVAGVTGAAAIKVLAPLTPDEWPHAFVVDRAYVERAEPRVGREEAIWRHWETPINLISTISDEGLRARRSLRQDDDLHVPHLGTVLQRALDERTWPEGAVALAHGRPADPAAPTPPTVEAAPGDEAELAELIARFDLPPELIETARWGLAFVEGGGNSRVGGSAELDGEWPEVDGRALTHLMTIALDELPEVPGRELLPARGRLVLLAALDDEDELVEAVPGDDPRVHLRHFAPGTALTPREGDPDWTLDERRGRLVPVLTLPHRRIDLRPDLEIGYDQLIDALARVTPGLWPLGHLVLGHPNFIGWDPRAPGEIAVLHFGYDFEISLDGRHFTVHGAPEDLRAGRWERLTVTPQF